MGRKLAVLGGGISGLCLAYYLKKYYPEDEVKVFEKNSRPGGVIDAYKFKDLVFDKGPKTIRKSSGQDLLTIIDELGLSSEVITASLATKHRYIFYKNSLKKVPTSLIQWLVSPLTRVSLIPLIKELFIKKSTLDDLSIGDFAREHVGLALAENIVEPFVKGVCGSHMDKLSLRSCFPRLFELKQEHGSIIKGMLKNKKKSDKQLFNLKGGFARLIDALASLGTFEIKYHQNVKDLKWHNGKASIITEEKTFFADKVFSTLPLNVMQTLLHSVDSNQHRVFDETFYESLVGVSCAFKEDVLKKKGFGYLVPIKENQQVFGAIFDSCIFPDMDGSLHTKITLLMPDCSDSKARDILNITLQKHLNIRQQPAHIQVFNYHKALVRYPVGFYKILDNWLAEIKTKAPWLECCGNYRHPPGVNYCVAFSKEIAKTHGVIR
jgi:oxygen-dependent protoporphyrinogen oxidase